MQINKNLVILFAIAAVFLFTIGTAIVVCLGVLAVMAAIWTLFFGNSWVQDVKNWWNQGED